MKKNKEFELNKVFAPVNEPSFTFIDLFAGIGGFRIALQNLGGKCVYSSEFDKNCQITYAANFGEIPYGDITLDETKSHIPNGFDVLCGGFPCFVGGTKVLTDDGFKKIEEISIGDKVLTMEGGFNYVTATMSSNKDKIVRIKPQGFYKFIETTTNHPFLVIKRGSDTPEWVHAEDIHHLDKVGFRCIEGDLKLYTPEFWKLIGRFLGDGWVVHYKRKGRKNSYFWKVIICSSHDEKDECLKIIQDAGFKPSIVKERTVYKFHIHSKELCEFCMKFGKYSYGKKLSNECFQLDYDRKKSLWDGYVSSDGHKIGNVTSVTSTSEELILGFSQIVRDIFKRPYAVFKIKPKRKKCIIEGREVSERPFYRLSVSEKESDRYGYYKDGFVWMNVKKIETVDREETVYNISVDTSETYTVYGVTVHNCQPFSMQGKHLGFEDKTRGTLFFHIADIAKKHQPKAIFLENVKGLVGHNKGKTLETILNTLCEVGYDVVPPQIVDAHNFGLAQHRERVYIIAFRKDLNVDVNEFKYPEPTDTTKRFIDVREENPVDAKYYMSKSYLETLERHKARNEGNGNGFGYAIIPDDGVTNTILAVGGSGKERNLVIDKRQTDMSCEKCRKKGGFNDQYIRVMTPREWARLQGFPEEFRIVVADGPAYKQFGNSVAIPAIQATAKEMIKFI